MCAVNSIYLVYWKLIYSTTHLKAIWGIILLLKIGLTVIPAGNI